MNTEEKIKKIMIVGMVIALCYLTYELYTIEQKLNELEKTECNIK